MAWIFSIYSKPRFAAESEIKRKQFAKRLLVILEWCEDRSQQSFELEVSHFDELLIF